MPHAELDRKDKGEASVAVRAAVLLVDDDPSLARLAEFLLTQAGFEVHMRDSAESALAFLAEQPVDLVITDVYLPEMDGLRLLARIREDEPALPVVLMTAHGNERVAMEALRKGAASYVPKSDLRLTLVGTVEAVLGHAAGRRHQALLASCLQSARLQYRLPSDLDLVKTVVAEVHEQLRRVSFGDEAVRLKVGLALREALTNAIVHGNLEVDATVRSSADEAYRRVLDERTRDPHFGQRTVDLLLEADDAHATFVVSDQGPGYATLGADGTSTSGHDRPGGRGLFLIKRLMDEVTLRDGGRTIEVVKHHSRDSA